MAITREMLRRGKAISQENRLGAFHPPDGGTRSKTHDLALIRFDGTEAVNAPFEFRVECVAVKPNIDFDTMLGRHASVEVQTVDPALPPRFFDGLVTEARWLGIRHGGHGYEVILRPTLWLLTLRRDQRIFHNMRAPEILNAVLQGCGVAVEEKLSENYPVLEYTVQYRETDFEFVSRLMARFGINYHFRHKLHAHTMVLTDSNDTFDTAPGGKRPFRPVQGQHRDATEHFSEWHSGRAMTTGKISMTDYDFKKPATSMGTDHSAGHGYEFGEIDSFEYPGGYVEPDMGRTAARLRSRQAASGDRRFTASGDAISLGPGDVFMMVDAPREYTDLDREEFIVLQARHRYEAEGYQAGDSKEGGGGTGNYTSSFDLVMRDVPVVPPPIPACSLVSGPQTATVVGEGEIDCDEHGRILVRFHWDRAGAHSMRCRVAQMWAGNGWGGIVIPRIGMEVVVQFLEGDPDQPLVVGCVYNGQNAPPFDLPGAKNQAGIRSNSTPGGGGYNEIVLDDTKDNELFRQHAQYDMETTVLNDERRNIGQDRDTEIGRDESLIVGKDRDTDIGEKLSTKIGNSETRDVGTSRTTNVGTSDTLDVGSKLAVEAGQSIELKVGMSSITIGPDKITLKSPTVEVKAMMTFSTSAGMESKHSAGVMVDIKGGLVKINS